MLWITNCTCNSDLFKCSCNKLNCIRRHQYFIKNLLLFPWWQWGFGKHVASKIYKTAYQKLPLRTSQPVFLLGLKYFVSSKCVLVFGVMFLSVLVIFSSFSWLSFEKKPDQLFMLSSLKFSREILRHCHFELLNIHMLWLRPIFNNFYL